MNINFKKIFNWDIHSVSEPVAVYANSNVSEIIGYNVIVYYTHHGAQHHFFGMDDRRCWVMYAGPKEAAGAFYEEMKKKQSKQARKKTYDLYR